MYPFGCCCGFQAALEETGFGKQLVDDGEGGGGGGGGVGTRLTDDFPADCEPVDRQAVSAKCTPLAGLEIVLKQMRKSIEGFARVLFGITNDDNLGETEVGLDGACHLQRLPKFADHRHKVLLHGTLSHLLFSVDLVERVQSESSKKPNQLTR